jgi:peptidoglycan biosynthesis protein MviN/MurJ (putative lipid II flippase)
VLLGGLWIGGLLGSLTSSAFYAVGDTQTPTWMTVVLYTLYVPLKFWAFYRWGMEGLAISISGYYLLSVGIQLLLLYRKGLAPAWMIRR